MAVSDFTGYTGAKGTDLAAEAVANGTDALNAESLADVLDALLHNGVDLDSRVLGEPVGDVGLAGVHIRRVDGVTVEQVGDDSQVAIVGELVGDELGICEGQAEDVGDEDDGLLGGLVVLGGGNVGLDWRTIRASSEDSCDSTYLHQCSSLRPQACLHA
jgi:hypothetical protein